MISVVVALLAIADGGELDLPDAGDLPAIEEDAGVEVADAGVPVADAPRFEDAGVRPPRELATVVVGTSEERTAGSVHTIKSSRLQRFELDDPMAVLQSVPGVYVRGEDGFGLRPNVGLRGANADRSKKVTLMEDGVLFGPAPYTAPAAYYFPLVTRMESVRVVKGPGGVLYGPATVGGAIDFITRDIPSGTVGGADLALGQYGYGKLHGWFGSSNETSGFLVEALHVRSSGFKQLDGVGGDTGFGRTEVMAKARHALELGPTHHVLSLKLGFSAEESNETYLGLTDADFEANPLRRYAASQLDHMSNHRESAALTHKLEVGGVTVTTTGYLNLFSRVWRRFDHFSDTLPSAVLAAPNTPRNQVYYGILTGQVETSSPADQLVLAVNDRSFLAGGVQSSLRTAFSTGPVSHSLEVQARYHYDRALRHHTGERYDVRSGAMVRADAPVEELLWNLDDTKAFALAAIDAMRWGPVTLTPGVRFELIRSRSNSRLTGAFSNGGANALLPGIGVHWAIIPELGVLAGVYRGFTPPAAGQAVPPEYSVNYEAGARWARRGERVELVGFFNDYSNLTSLCTASAGCSEQQLDMQYSAGAARIFGLEAYAEKTWRFGAVSVPVSAAYTFTQTALLTAFDSADPQLASVQEGDELPYVPRHQLNLSAGVDVWRISAHAQLNFVDRMREVAGQGDDGVPLTDPQLVIDVHLGFKVFEWLRVYGDARNLADNRAIVARRPFGARPNAPRTFIAGIKLDY